MKCIACLGALTALLHVPAAARAEIVVHLPTVEIQTVGDAMPAGFVDIRIELDPPDANLAASSFNLDFSVSGSEIQFGSAALAPSPLFASPPQDFSPHEQRSRSAVDVFPSSVALFDGAGLVRVPFLAAASATGEYVLTWNALNELTDATAAPLPIQLSGAGLISIERFEAGDYNFDGDVNGADFLTWQRGASPDPLSEHDLADWERRFGASPALLQSSFAAPEPSALCLLLAGGAFSPWIRQFLQ